MGHAVSGNNDEANGSDIPSPVSQPLQFRCADGVLLAGHLWQGGGRSLVIINAATGVLARYYHRYAAFLAGRGFDAITYDYRGIGDSRPPRLKGCGYRWREWGTQDRSEEHTSELQSLMRNSYAVFCLKKKKTKKH